MSEINNKEILYKIYDSAGTFITTWTDVVSDLKIDYTLNGGISNLTVRLARLESDFGEGEDVKQGNLLKILVFDGDSGVNGVQVYSGVLVSYTPIIASGGAEYIDVEFYSHYWDLNNKILLSGQVSIYDSVYLEDSTLKAYYRFESGSTLIDSSGNEHTLTAIGSATTVDGKFGECKSFDGNDAYSAVDDADLKPTGAFTVGCWVKSSNEDFSSSRFILQSFSNSGDPEGWRIYQNLTTGIIQFALSNGTTYYASFGSACNDGNWHSLIATYNGTDTGCAYLDGVLAEEDTGFVVPTYNSPNYVRIACRSQAGSDDNFFIGEIDDVFLLNGKALSAAEILALYTNGYTEVVYNSYDPSNILKDVLTKHSALGGVLSYTNDTIDLTSTTVSYTFNTNTIQDAVKKVIELCPENWFFRVGADDYIYLEEMEATPSHYFTIGKDISEYKPEKRFDNIVNTIYFRGKDTLYKKYTNSSSISTYGVRAITLVDERVSVEATADIMAAKILDEKNSPEIRVVIKVMDNNGEAGEMGYDIESIKVGQTCKIENATSKSNNLWDESLWDTDAWDYEISNLSATQLQIVSVEYHLDYAILELSNRQPDISKRIEDINRNLKVRQNADNPSLPDE